jgi:hypothetical protein
MKVVIVIYLNVQALAGDESGKVFCEKLERRFYYFLRKLQLRNEDDSFHRIIENEYSHGIRNDHIKL